MIRIYIDKLKSESIKNISVLDLAAGKGGDLQKWLKSGIRHMVAVDIAKSSLEELKERYLKINEKKFSLTIVEGDLRENPENIYN